MRFISCDGHQLYDFKERGVDLEVEDVQYIQIHRGQHKYWARLLRGAEISNYRGRSQCVLVKIWRSIYMEHLPGLASECRCYINSRYKTFVGTLHCALENGADLYVNERQKIGHYRARSTEERKRRIIESLDSISRDR